MPDLIRHPVSFLSLLFVSLRGRLASGDIRQGLMRYRPRSRGVALPASSAAAMQRELTTSWPADQLSVQTCALSQMTLRGLRRATPPLLAGCRGAKSASVDITCRERDIARELRSALTPALSQRERE